MGLLKISGSDNFYKIKRGFTLVEVLLVLALFVIILSFGIVIGLDAYRRNNFKTERNNIAIALQRARSQSINNINNNSHGFYFDGTKYIIFEGTSSVSRIEALDIVLSKNSSIKITGLNEVVFKQLSGNTNIAVSDFIILDDGISSTTILINQEGRVSW